MSVTDEELMNEAKNTVELARKKDVVLRVSGGCAVKIHCPKFLSLHNALGRKLHDIDLIGYMKQKMKIYNLIVGLNYKPRVAMLFHRDRFMFDNPTSGLVLEVFLDKLPMCHTIDFKNRLEIDYPTIPVVDILLEKLQNVTISEKDIKDIMILLREHQIGENDDDAINVKRLREILCDDWGFYHSSFQNLDKTEAFLKEYPALRDEDRSNVREKIAQLRREVDLAPKTLKWKTRSKLGTSVAWYTPVEDLTPK